MKKTLKIIISAIITTLILINSYSFATNIKNVDISKLSPEQINELTSELSNSEIDELVETYETLLDTYSNEEIAQAIEENKEKISEETGISQSLVGTAATILKNTDEETTKQIAEEISDKKTLESDTNNSNNIDVPVKLAAKISAKVIFANAYIQKAIKTIGIETILLIILRWIIFSKAGEHGWASIIPIYREIVYLKVCNISPWCLILLLLPIIGWLILGIIFIVSRFKLAKRFNKGFFFGLGLLFFSVIFELILAIQLCNSDKKEN